MRKFLCAFVAVIFLSSPVWAEWGESLLDNDASAELRDRIELLGAQDTLTDALKLPDGDIENDKGSTALAAAELVAEAKEGKTDMLPAPLRRKIDALPKPLPEALVSSARNAVARILKSPDMLRLHANAPSWKTNAEQLLKRLSD